MYSSAFAWEEDWSDALMSLLCCNLNDYLFGLTPLNLVGGEKNGIILCQII